MASHESPGSSALDPAQRPAGVVSPPGLDEGPPVKDRTGDRLIALVIAAALAFNYPLLFLFSKQGLLFGIPVFYLYLFLAWGVLIPLVALVMERRSGHAPEEPVARSGEDPPGA